MFIFIRILILILLISSYAFAQTEPIFYSDEVVVTASRHLELASETPFNITIITSKEIETSGDKNVGDILQKQFGIYPKTKGFLGSEYSISLRGSSYQQVLVLIDGVDVNSPLLGGADVGDILLNNVERIEIVRGPLSSMYGSDAVGGVINIITKNADQQQRLSFDAKLMERGTQKIVSSYSENNCSLTLGHDESPGYFDNSGFNSNNFSFKINANIYGGESSLLYKTYFARKEIPGSIVMPYADAWQTDSNEEVIYNWKSKNVQTKLFNIQKLQKVNLNPSTSDDEKYNSYSGGGEVQLYLNIADNHKLVYGIDYKTDSCDSTYAGVNSVVNSAVFIEDEYVAGEIVKINYGARFDSHSVFGGNSSPRIGILYAINQKTKMRLTYGESFRAPTLNDLYWYNVDPVWGTIMRGSTDLEPEKAKSIELGLDHQVTDSLHLNTSVFTSGIQNLIQWVDISGTWATWEAQNVGKAEITGAELEIKYFVNSDVNIYSNYTYQQAFNSETFKYLTYRPKDQYNIGFNYGDDAGNLFNSNLRYVGWRFDNVANTTKVPAYSVVDFRYEKKMSSISAYFGSENIFDEVYQDTLNYPMPGRIYYFGIKYSL